MADNFYYQDPRSSQRDIAPLAIKNRHVESISADKITTGTLQANTSITVGDTTTGNYKISTYKRDVWYNNNIPAIVIGDPS